MSVNTGAIANLLRPGLKDVVTTYDMYKQQWSQIFETHNSDKAVEIDVEMRMLGLAQFRAEGAATAFDNQMGQRAVTNYVNRYVSLGFVITHQAMADNLYKTDFPQWAKALRHSLDQTKEVNAASILNNGFNAAFPIGDAQPLFSLNHPIDGGVQANMPAVFSDLNEASLEQALISVQQFRDPAGLIVSVKGEKLIVGPQNQMVASRLLNSQYRINTPNNDISAIVHDSYIPKGYAVNQFITQLPGNLNTWILLTNAPSGFKHYVRMKPESDIYVDFQTDNLLCKATERYSFGVTNWRAAWGNHGV